MMKILSELLCKCNVEYDIRPVPGYDAYVVGFHQGSEVLLSGIEISGFEHEFNWEPILKKLVQIEIPRVSENGVEEEI